MKLFQNKYEKERQAKLGQKFDPLGQLWLLVVIWLIWAFIMGKIACWLSAGIHAFWSWFNSPNGYAFLDGQLIGFDQVTNSWSFTNFGNYTYMWTVPLLYWVIEGALAVVIVPILMRIWVKHRPDKSFQYGNNRFTTTDEIVTQYPQVPDRNVSFAGYGGVPVAHLRFWNPSLLKHHLRMVLKNLVKGVFGYYSIDQNTNNTLVVGITRSGKGETFVMPTLDLQSRAEKQASFVTTDPKKELYQSSYKKLRQRGYNVQVLDLQDPDVSMSYNPLARAVQLAKDGYYDQVQQEVNTFSSSIYVDPNAKDKFWQNSSINLLNALIMALIDYAKRNNDWSKVTMYNAVHMMTGLGGSEANVNQDNDIVWDEADAQLRGEISLPDSPEQQVAETKNKLTLYFEHLTRYNEKVYSPFRTMAIESFAQSKFAGEETSGNIYSSAMEGIKIYQQSDIAKLTSMNSINFEQMGFPRILKVRFKQFANYKQLVTAKISFMDKKNKVIVSGIQQLDNLGYLNYAVKPTLPDNFTLSISFNFHRNVEEVLDKSIIFECSKQYEMENGQPKLDEFTGKPVFKTIKMAVKVNKMGQAPSSFHIEYTEKPIALFLVTPPNNPSYNQVASFAIDQCFNQIYSLALKNGRKAYRRVEFNLDEFGNLPAIQKMDTKVSIGLGQNILFNIVVQNLEQLNAVYGEKVGSTIQSNCANLLYILTKSNKTAKEISEQLGKRTVKVTTYSGQVGSIHSNNASQQYISQDLLTVPELEQLMGGEMVVLRSVYRQDQAGHSIAALPIFDTGHTKMPFAHQLLKSTFSTNTTDSDIGLDSKHRLMKLEKSLVDFNKVGGAFDQLGTVDQLADPEFLKHGNVSNEHGFNEAKKLKKIAAQGMNDAIFDKIDQQSSVERPIHLPTKTEELNIGQLHDYTNPDRTDLIKTSDDLPDDCVLDLDQLQDKNLCRACTDILVDQLKKTVPPSDQVAIVTQYCFDDPHLWWQHHRHNSWGTIQKMFMQVGTPQSGSMYKACKRRIKNQIQKAMATFVID